jgi:hypothetical protein
MCETTHQEDRQSLHERYAVCHGKKSSCLVPTYTYDEKNQHVQIGISPNHKVIHFPSERQLKELVIIHVQYGLGIGGYKFP